MTIRFASALASQSNIQNTLSLMSLKLQAA